MTEDVRQKAEQTLKEVEAVTTALLPSAPREIAKRGPPGPRLNPKREK